MTTEREQGGTKEDDGGGEFQGDWVGRGWFPTRIGRHPTFSWFSILTYPPSDTEVQSEIKSLAALRRNIESETNLFSLHNYHPQVGDVI